MKNSAQIVRDARVERGWTMTRLAVELGVSVATVSRLEAGLTRGDETTVRRLLDVLDLPDSFVSLLTLEAAAEHHRTAVEEVVDALAAALRSGNTEARLPDGTVVAQFAPDDDAPPCLACQLGRGT